MVHNVRRCVSRGNLHAIPRDPIQPMSRALSVSAAGSDAWRSRPERTRSVNTRTLLSASRVIHQEFREPYGSPRIWDALIKQGHHIGAHRVDRLMRIDGIRAKTVKRWRATTQSNHRWPVAENTLNRQFTVAHPTRVWAGDCTDVWTTAGWLSLAVILDLYSRRVIGWARGHRLTVEWPSKPAPWRWRAGTHWRTPAPLRSRQSVCRHEVPAGAAHSRHHHQYEPQR